MMLPSILSKDIDLSMPIVPILQDDSIPEGTKQAFAHEHMKWLLESGYEPYDG